MSLLNVWPHRVRHDRRTTTRTASLGQRHAAATISASVKCWIQQASQAEVKEFAKQDHDVSVKIYMPEDPGLRPGDELVVISGPSYVGEEFDYQAGQDATAGLAAMHKAMCRRRRNEQPEALTS